MKQGEQLVDAHLAGLDAFLHGLALLFEFRALPFGQPALRVGGWSWVGRVEPCRVARLALFAPLLLPSLRLLP